MAVTVNYNSRSESPANLALMLARFKAMETRAKNATLSQIRQLQSSVEVLSASDNGSEFAKALSDAETALKRLAVFF